METETKSLSDDLLRAVELLADAFAARSIRYAMIGGLAVMLRGRPRFTQDIDFVIEVPQIVLPGLLDDLVARGFTLDPTTVIQQFVRQHITAIDYRGIRIDWLKPVLPLYSRTLKDATELPWNENRTLRVATPEGLILTKMVAFRLQDQVDIETLLVANRDEIDLDVIRSEWAPFRESEPERTAWLDAAVAKHVPPRAPA